MHNNTLLRSPEPGVGTSVRPHEDRRGIELADHARGTPGHRERKAAANGDRDHASHLDLQAGRTRARSPFRSGHMAATACESCVPAPSNRTPSPIGVLRQVGCLGSAPDASDPARTVEVDTPPPAECCSRRLWPAVVSGEADAPMVDGRVGERRASAGAGVAPLDGAPRAGHSLLDDG
jgi:hypothetical protein